jgi:SNF2 family DNA or RNA helicase
VEIPGLLFKPHIWQTKGAAQGHYLCEHPDFRIFFCGDEMGLGKTLLAVLMAKKAQAKPGFCVVVAPKPVCDQWVDEFARAFTKVRCDRFESLDSTC